MTYPIPSQALDDRHAFVGTAGSGKTYNAGSAVERLLLGGARAIIFDPLDVWWGLRLDADGKRESRFRPVIFGGPHGDLPLNERSGALLGETCAKMAESCIVSFGDFPSKASERRFMLDFLVALEKHANREPVHLVFDEADLWAPQMVRDRDGEAMKLLGMMEQIVRRGRIKGFVPWLITQRPAVLNKNVLSQADGLIAFKLTSSQDRDAIGAWIEGQADRAQGREILASLPAMQVGQGVVWIPGRGVLETAQFPAKATFDSSRTPKRGEVVRSTTLKPLDLGALKDRLASIEEEVKASDPKALKAEVARLTRELARAERAKVAPPPPPAPVIANAEEIAAARAEGERVGIAIGLSRAQQALAALRVDGPAPERATLPQRAAPGPVAALPPPVTPAAGVTGPQQRILDALAWWRALGFEAVSRTQVAFIAAYKPNTGTFNTYLGQLSTGGLISYPRKGAVALTEQGVEKANEPDGSATLHERVKAILSGPQVRLLDPLLAAFPAALTRPELAEASGYQPNTGTFNTYLGQLSTLDLIAYPERGQVRAADWLFPG